MDDMIDVIKRLEAEIDKVCSSVCDELCCYNQTIDEDLECDYMKKHAGRCPLDKLYCLGGDHE